MELWIRSQNKKRLIKVDSVEFDTQIDGPTIIFTHASLLGEYETKERALEVLDEIQRKLQPSLYIYEPKEYDKPKTITDATPSLRIYEMPKE